MARKTFPSGVLPADFTPSTKDKAPRGVENLADRLENLLGGTLRMTPVQQVKCAKYLLEKGEPRMVAECMGVEHMYDRLAAIREREAAASE